MQPDAINGAVEKPNSSAPNNAPITTSRPVLSPPSTWTDIRDLSLFFIKVWCVSAKPSSQGEPACFTEVRGLAPVPPSIPEIVTWSAFALATPAATVPTPTSDTNFTDISAFGLTFLRSNISCAKSSIE